MQLSYIYFFNSTTFSPSVVASCLGKVRSLLMQSLARNFNSSNKGIYLLSISSDDYPESDSNYVAILWYFQIMTSIYTYMVYICTQLFDNYYVTIKQAYLHIRIHTFKDPQLPLYIIQLDHRLIVISFKTAFADETCFWRLGHIIQCKCYMLSS